MPYAEARPPWPRLVSILGKYARVIALGFKIK
jgi:hypothetical protein